MPSAHLSGRHTRVWSPEEPAGEHQRARMPGCDGSKGRSAGFAGAHAGIPALSPWRTPATRRARRPSLARGARPSVPARRATSKGTNAGLRRVKGQVRRLRERPCRHTCPCTLANTGDTPRPCAPPRTPNRAPQEAPNHQPRYAVRSPERAAYPRLEARGACRGTSKGTNAGLRRVKGQVRRLRRRPCRHTCPFTPAITGDHGATKGTGATASCSCRWPARRSWSLRRTP